MSFICAGVSWAAAGALPSHQPAVASLRRSLCNCARSTPVMWQCRARQSPGGRRFWALLPRLAVWCWAAPESWRRPTFNCRTSTRVMKETNLQLPDINQSHGGDQPSTAGHQPESWRRPTFNCLTSTRVMEETNLQLPEINQSHGRDQLSTAWDQPESWRRPTFNCLRSTSHGRDQLSTAWDQPESWRRPTSNCLTSTTELYPIGKYCMFILVDMSI